MAAGRNPLGESCDVKEDGMANLRKYKCEKSNYSAMIQLETDGWYSVTVWIDGYYAFRGYRKTLEAAENAMRNYDKHISWYLDWEHEAEQQ